MTERLLKQSKILRTTLHQPVLNYYDATSLMVIVPHLSRKRETLKLVRLSVHQSVCPSQKVNLAHIFWSINDRALIFGMHDPYDKPIHFAPCRDLDIHLEFLQGQSYCWAGDHHSPNLLVFAGWVPEKYWGPVPDRRSHAWRSGVQKAGSPAPTEGQNGGCKHKRRGDHAGYRYYALQSNLQIQRSALLMMDRCMQVISNLLVYLSRGSITWKWLHAFQCIHVGFKCGSALKRNTVMISLYWTNTASEELNDANWVNDIVNL